MSRANISDFVPYRSRHPLTQRFVHCVRHKRIGAALPQMNRPMDRRDVEWPLLVEHLRIGHETVNALPEALASGLHDGTQHIVISKRREVSGAARLQQCLLVLLRKPRRSEIDQVIH
ncbi:hypothetical protein ABIB99_002304 [Bradyrhizobium sp. LA6.1]